MAALDDLAGAGQAIWIADLHRGLLDAGGLERLVRERRVTGAVLAPAVLERAVAAGIYDEHLERLHAQGITDPAELTRALVVADAGAAAEVLAGAYESPTGATGWVGVAPATGPGGDDEDPLDAARDAHAAAGRPNVLVELPPGLAGIGDTLEQLAAEGVPVCVSPVCLPERASALVAAWSRGLRRRADAGMSPDVALVLAVPLARIDAVTAAGPVPDGFTGAVGLAVALAVRAAVDAAAGPDRVPVRVACTGLLPPDPTQPDTAYLAPLAGAGGVAVLATGHLEALAGVEELGTRQPVAGDRDAVLAAVRAAGTDLDLALAGIERDATERLGWARARLLDATTTRVERLGAPLPRPRERLAAVADTAARVTSELIDASFTERLWGREHRLWQEDPTEVTDRLGWLLSPTQMEEQLAELDRLVDEVVGEGLTDAVLLGMGGSSLFPEVLAATFGTADDRLRLHVLDTTDPAAVGRIERDLDLDRTLFVASSKSGSTIETTSQLAHFWDLVREPKRFVAVTDPGSPLAERGERDGFRRVYLNRPDIGGRYSALSWFGLVPAALIGVDVEELLARAGRMLLACGPGAGPHAPGLRLGAAMGAAAQAGRDKLTVVLPAEVDTFGLWLEQLVAESTGKGGTGILPVVGEPVGGLGAYGADRLFVVYGAGHTGIDELAAAGHPVIDLPWWGEPLDLGVEVVRWEVATAVAGAVLGINPFDQPDVAAAKEATAEVLQSGAPHVDTEPLAGLLAGVRPGDYVAIQAYVDPGSDVVERLDRARVALRDDLGVATTVGLGPRFLHSTGQLHKGGPPTGVFVQVVGDDPEDVPIPGRPYGFSTLKHAQADGDLQALRDRGLRAGRVALDDLLAVGAT